VQEDTAAVTAAYSINILNEIFEDRLVNRRLQLIGSPNLSPCDFYLWGNLKNKVYLNSHHTVDELKQNICEAITSAEANELKLAPIFSRDLKFKNRRETF
jgi:hypothetical protein